MGLVAMLSAFLRRLFQLLLIISGNVPEHVAFVMDGNRRYAEQQHVDKATGHTHGYGKMVEVIHWCMELGVKHVTVYAFSIDNFQRSPEEVGALMHLAEAKYAELAQDDGLAEREGIQMHIVGDLELPPPPVQGAAARLMRNTATLRRRRATLNVCFSYTSSEETVAAVDALQAAVRSGELRPADVTPEALTASLRTPPSCPPVDLLIRTSGETRLSDFLLWQASPHAQLCYLDVLWPSLSYLDFAKCVLSYQRSWGHLEGVRRRVEGRLGRALGAGVEGEGMQEGEGVGKGEGIAVDKGVVRERDEGNPQGTGCLGRREQRSQGWVRRCMGLLRTAPAWWGVRSGGAVGVTQGRMVDGGHALRLLRYLAKLEGQRQEWINRHVHL